MARMMLVHRCVMRRAPASLCERVQVNNHGTRGNNKLLLRRPRTDFFRSFWGAQDWNSLPNYMRTINSVFTHLKTNYYVIFKHRCLVIFYSSVYGFSSIHFCYNIIVCGAGLP